MRTVQGAALDGLRARVRALAERTGLPVRTAPGAARLSVAPAAGYRWPRPVAGGAGRPPRAGTPLADRGPAVRGLRAESPGRLTSVKESFPRTAALVRDFVTARPRPGTARASATVLRALRARYGDAPVLVRDRSGRAVLVLLAPDDVYRFYAEPQSVLAADQPQTAGLGCAHAEPGPEQRQTAAEVLAAGVPVHPACGPFLAAVTEEALHLTASGTLELARARYAVGRAARRIVLGEAAAADEELAGWLGQSRAKSRARAARRIQEYARHAGADTLLGRAARHAGPAGVPDPSGQAHQWLQALDSLPATLLRTLLLLGAHPAEQDATAAEAAGGASRGELPRLRSCVRETLRLYPVVPDLIRVTRTETEWQGVRYPAGTSVLLPAAFHQRDPERVPAAHVFVPGRWKNPGADQDTRMAPFGHGGSRCPGDQLGLLLTAAFCAEVLRDHRVASGRPALDPVGPLPATLDPHGIRLTLTRR
ncbi:cytochrome P450 [Streptomyces sp. NBC_00190]|uniref:cytochrome P450 n=1 Tax=unclassified Streptomyces TaxID=2593676 RepID=UPI002E2983FF|nr:cytochrome P450 [Streptomyces sp. NBC_00190]WSZ44024.1 cytochrome P450 [Streptomyces sp. NBC_00868]